MLVAGRECGACTACCVYMPIRTEPLSKPASVACPHCAGGGCAIHERRPPVCREWFCAWRLLPQLDDSWRPDRSGLMLRPWTDDKGSALIVMVIGDAAALLDENFARFIADGVRNRQRVYLEVPARPHFHAEMELLNNHVAQAVADEDAEAMQQAMMAVYMRLVLKDKEPDGIAMRIPA